MHKKALKHQQFVMVDPVDQFKFYVSRLCFEFFIHSGNLAGVATWLEEVLWYIFKKFRSNQSQQKKKSHNKTKKFF